MQANEVQQMLLQDIGVCEFALDIVYDDCRLHVRCSDESVRDELSIYFRHWLTSDSNQPQSADYTIYVHEVESPLLSAEFESWPRESGKTGSAKDSYFDLAVGRVVRKVRTGMVFLQSPALLIAAGPCRTNLNQVINFICHQLLNRSLQHDSLIGHAAALSIDDKALAIAGFSGGGKSTCMLHLMDLECARFISNDRVFMSAANGQVSISGLPKLPRINPGTIVGNPRLHELITAARLEELRAMDRPALWELEEKHDVDVEEIWGEDRIRDQGMLNAVFLLNWALEDSNPFKVQQIDPEQRADLLPAIMKSRGVFYMDASGEFDVGPVVPNQSLYVGLLQQVSVYEVTGVVDFSAFKDWVANHYE